MWRSGLVVLVLALWLAGSGNARAAECSINADCDDGVSCTVDVCNAGACLRTPDDSLCSDSEYCNGAETCDPVLGCVGAMPLDCDDDIYCTEDSCDEINDTCVNTALDEVCSNELYCDGEEICDPLNGDAFGCAAGEDVVCDDGLSCTNDVCSNSSSSCEFTPVNSRCDDTLHCNGVEACKPLDLSHDENGCVPGDAVPCDDNISCTVDACNDDIDACEYVASNAACDDDNPCTGPDTCEPDDFLLWPSGCNQANLTDGTPCPLPGGVGSGICLSGQCLDTCFQNSHCDDGLSCTVDACVAGSCQNTPNSSACDDMLYCNGAETCAPEDPEADPTSGCIVGDAVDCADAYACTVDSCNEGTDSCDHVNDNAACIDDLYCNGVEACNPGAPGANPTTGCTPGASVDCADSQSCTVDSCNESTDSCDHTPNHAACSDDNPCTADTCDAGSGCSTAPVQDGTACGEGLVCLGGVCSDVCEQNSDCDDFIDCTVDTCNTETFACVNTPTHSICSDFDVCTGTEVCDPTNGQADATTGCVDGTPLSCNDNDPCTSNNCNPTTGCNYPNAPDGSVCDVLPQIPEVCSAGECVPACIGDEECNDHIDCTVDVCSDVTHLCVNTTSNSYCNDFFICNGTETCNPGGPGADPNTGCVAGTPMVCDDNISCTIDTCSNGSGGCVFTPSNAACSDSNVCTGTEACNPDGPGADPTSGCLAGTPLTCDDSDPCTADSCDAVDGCTATAQPDGAVCDSEPGVPEVCLDGQCVPSCSSDQDCNDGISCTVDSCDPQTHVCVHAVNNAVCDDSDVCNGVEFCNPSIGCIAGTPLDCGDAYSCTTDACDPDTGCNNTPNNAACNNAQFCDGTETCDPGAPDANPGTGCLPGTPVDCSDTFSCTTTYCDENTDSCQTIRDDSACDDSQYCNGVETCTPGDPGADAVTGCMPGIAPTCDDSVACTIDACDEDQDDCTHTTNDAACSDSLYCNGVETCTLAGCVAGEPVNCNDGIACTTDACNESTDSCTNVANNALCSNHVFCDGQEVCSLTLGCIDGEPPTCNDNIPCTVDSCDAVNDSCSYEADNTVCDDLAWCNGTEFCMVGLGCMTGAAPNCVDNVDCTDDTCNELTDSCDYTPDNGACSDDLYCNGQETCNRTLGCQPGSAIVCNDHVDCTADTCSNEQSACEYTPSDASCPDPGPCQDLVGCDAVQGCLYTNHPDDESCDIEPGVNEVCRGGQCVGPCVFDTDCDDGIACTVDTCGGDGFCGHAPLNSLCDNQVFCDGAELCVPGIGCQAQANRDCDDNASCTIDSCDEVNDTCVHVAQHEQCGDSLWCNGDESCDPEDPEADERGCAPAPDRCNDDIACTQDTCDEDAQTCGAVPLNSNCDDDVYCNGSEICQPGNENADANGCLAMPAPICDDGFACTSDTCDLDLDACVFTPQNSACDDDAFCNGSESCDPESELADEEGCVAGSEPCDDSVLCTLDSCDENADLCGHAPSNVLCNNVDFCDGMESCDPDSGEADVNGCIPGSDPCIDNIACTSDSCNEQTDTCVYTPQNQVCDDSLYCNGQEACDPQAQGADDNGCVAGETPCDDGVACTVDGCNEETDQCTASPDDSLCSDAQFCNGAELCEPNNGSADGNGCVSGSDPCDDSIACTADSCDEAGDQCIHETDDSACQDNTFCNGAEVCVAGVGCQPGEAPDCSDSVDCTVDSCSEQTDDCVHVADDALCSNNVFCDGAEICSASQGCLDGTPPSCADTIPCTVDSCDSELDDCVHAPDDAACADGLFCNGTESCDVEDGCQNGTPRTCDDGVDCTVDSCNEADDICLHDLNDAACQDGQFCNGDELCSIEGCYSVARYCDDDVDCTLDTCNEDDDECVFTPDDEFCEDSNPCTIEHTCDIESGCWSESVADDTPCDIDPELEESCQQGECVPDCVTDLDCDDGFDCTTESCNANSHCQYVPDDSVCNAGAAFCDPILTCVVRQGCVEGDPIDCGDDIACTVDLCSDLESACLHEPDDGFCNDNNPCTIDSCDDQSGCSHVNEEDGTTCGVDYICDNGECVPPIVDGDIVDGDVIDGDVIDGDVIDGDVIDGDVIDGDVIDGDVIDGDVIDGDAIDGDVIDGDAIDGDVIDGDVIDGDLIDGDVIDGDVIDGDVIDGDVIDGDEDREFGDEPVDVDPDKPDGDEPDGDVITGGGGGCSSSPAVPSWLWVAALLTVLASRRRRQRD
jgi:MYXO-CTERM domain-containing protein